MRMFLLPNETTPCSFFTSQQLMYNKTALGNDACAIGVIAGGGAVILCIAVLSMCAAVLCCCGRRRRRPRGVQRNKPLVVTQATSWFTNSLTMPSIKKKDCPQSMEQGDHGKGSSNSTKRSAKIEEDGRGHVYQTLQLDDLDYESMYTRTVPMKQKHNRDE